MSLDIVFGPMFSGKSSHAMSYIRRQRAIGKRVVVIKPDIDMRYSNQSVMVTHNGEQLPCTLWNTDIPLTPTTDIENAESIVIEEAQFLKGLYSFVKYALFALKKNILLVGAHGFFRRVLVRLLERSGLYLPTTGLALLCHFWIRCMLSVGIKHTSLFMFYQI